MGKPFDRELVRKLVDKTREFVDGLNNVLSRFEIKVGSLKDHDMSLVCRANRNVEVHAKLEVVRSCR